MSEVNFNSFKGIRGMNNAAGNSVCDYVNMIPTGDTALTRQGENVSWASQVWHSPFGDQFYIDNEISLIEPFTTCLSERREVKLLSSHTWNDGIIYYVWYVKGKRSEYSSTTSMLKNCPAYVFEVVNLNTRINNVNMIILEKQSGGGQDVDVNPYFENLHCSWARSTTASSKDFQETFFCDGRQIYVIRENGFVRYFPTPAHERYIESYANGPSHPTQEQLETTCDNLTAPDGASCYTLVEFWNGRKPEMEIAFFDNRLAVLYKDTNQLYLSKADPCEVLRGLRDVEDPQLYAAGYHTWYDCANKVAVLWPFSMSSSSTSEIAQHIATIGDVLAIINENTTELWSRTGDNTAPITSTVGSVIPFGSSVSPLSFGGKLYICGKDQLGTNVLLSISPDGSTSVASNVEVSKRLNGVTKLEMYRNHDMEHLLCVIQDDDTKKTAMAYCISNETWWYYKDIYTFKHCHNLLDNNKMSNFFGKVYAKSDIIGRFYVDPYYDIFATSYPYDLITTFSWYQRSGETSPSLQIDMPDIFGYEFVSNFNGSIPNGNLRYSQSLTECFTTFSKRAIIGSVALRESTDSSALDAKSSMQTALHLFASGLTINPNLPYTNPETESLQVSYDRGKTFNTAKARSLNGGRNDKEIIWRGLGSGNSMTLKFTHASEKPTQIYAIDINIQ